MRKCVQTIAKGRFEDYLWIIFIHDMIFLCLLAQTLEIGLYKLTVVLKYSFSLEFKHLNLYEIKYTNGNIAQWGKGNTFSVSRNHILIHLQELFEEANKDVAIGKPMDAIYLGFQYFFFKIIHQRLHKNINEFTQKLWEDNFKDIKQRGLL